MAEAPRFTRLDGGGSAPPGTRTGSDVAERRAPQPSESQRPSTLRRPRRSRHPARPPRRTREARRSADSQRISDCGIACHAASESRRQERRVLRGWTAGAPPRRELATDLESRGRSRDSRLSIRAPQRSGEPGGLAIQPGLLVGLGRPGAPPTTGSGRIQSRANGSNAPRVRRPARPRSAACSACRVPPSAWHGARTMRTRTRGRGVQYPMGLSAMGRQAGFADGRHRVPADATTR